jgi:formate hydrogenlyase transcriptional activator
VTNLLVTQHDLGTLLQSLSGCIGRLVQHEYASVSFYDGARDRLRVRLVVLDGERVPALENRAIQLTVDAAGLLAAGEVVVFDDAVLQQRNTELARTFEPEGLRSFCSVPLKTARQAIGVLSVASRRARAFTPADVNLIAEASGQIAIALENANAYEEIRQLEEQLRNENFYLEDELRKSHGFAGIVGESPALMQTLQQVERVAATDATVLLLGETGTGKELLARALHERSARQGRAFLRLNSGALPVSLVESELFGHERGAFTGAHAMRPGRLEIAHRGTLFLDEIGELPLEIQPKLLRALQAGEFQRLGSNETRKVDVRFIAATNHNLAAMVAEGRFRTDLFYRLNVFPIEVPPLRDRRADIPALVRHFVARHARRLGRPIDSIPASVVNALCRHDWPGNVRELDNVLERAVILSQRGLLRVSIPNETRPSVPSQSHPARLVDIEREAILSALRASAGVIAGPSGAAQRLGMKRTTLQSRMLKLGIRRSKY